MFGQELVPGAVDTGNGTPTRNAVAAGGGRDYTTQSGFTPIRKNAIPTAETLRHMFTPAGGNPNDIVSGKIYDAVALTTSVVNNVTFFNTVRNDLSLSNVENPGQLPSQQAFWMTGIRFELENNQDKPPDVGEMKEIFRQGSFTFTIANKPYCGPMRLAWFLNAIAPLAVSTRFFSINPFRTWVLDIPIPIPPLTTFSVKVTLTAPVFQSQYTYNIFCYLEGFIYRFIQ
jgi:hypothetical protein